MPPTNPTDQMAIMALLIPQSSVNHLNELGRATNETPEQVAANIISEALERYDKEADIDFNDRTFAQPLNYRQNLELQRLLKVQNKLLAEITNQALMIQRLTSVAKGREARIKELESQLKIN